MSEYDLNIDEHVGHTPNLSIQKICGALNFYGQLVNVVFTTITIMSHFHRAKAISLSKLHKTIAITFAQS